MLSSIERKALDDIAASEVGEKFNSLSVYALIYAAMKDTAEPDVRYMVDQVIKDYPEFKDGPLARTK